MFCPGFYVSARFHFSVLQRHDCVDLAMIWKIWRRSNLFLVFICLYRSRPPLSTSNCTNTCICLCLCVFFVFVWLSSCHCLFPCKFQRHYSSRRPSMHQSVLFHDQRTDKARVSVAGHLKNKCNFQSDKCYACRGPVCAHVVWSMRMDMVITLRIT